MNILYLYAELMGYQIPILEEYVNNYNAIVHVIHWDKKKLTPYQPPNLKNVIYYQRSEYSFLRIKSLINKICPDIVYVTGWQDWGYLMIAKHLRKMNIPVVCGFDDQWFGTFKQKFASFIGPYTLNFFFSHAWVAGPYQFEYARRLGFKTSNIIFNLLSCNTRVFLKGDEHIIKKASNYPHRFLYVGNFRHVKGTDILIKAFKIYREEYKGTWSLTCVGNGEMKRIIESESNVEVVDFTDQDGLIEIAIDSGVFILPSRLDQWGVVVHEFTSLGLPLILSENVGSKAKFLIENFNGFIYRNNDAKKLAEAMQKISNMSNSELVKMGKNSIKLSKAIDPTTSAANFLSIINNK